jgi:hypothetical protein
MTMKPEDAALVPDQLSIANALDRMSTLGLHDRIDELLTKATALSLVTYGEQGHTFRSLSGDMQDVYMWTLSDMISEIHDTWAAYLNSVQRDSRK